MGDVWESKMQVFEAKQDWTFDCSKHIYPIDWLNIVNSQILEQHRPQEQKAYFNHQVWHLQ